MVKKTDNHNPEAKLELRRYFLQKYHSEGIHVFDCCQGSKLLWSQLEKEFAVDSYWGVDLKEKKGRLKIDSLRIVQQKGWTQNVIDVDTYGSPWKHWLAILQTCTQPVSVFLTIGQIKSVGGFVGAPPKEITSMLSIPASTPATIVSRLWDFGAECLLAQALKYGTIVEAIESVSDGNARYIGVRYEPKSGLPAVDAADKPKQKRTKKESASVRKNSNSMD